MSKKDIVYVVEAQEDKNLGHSSKPSEFARYWEVVHGDIEELEFLISEKIEEIVNKNVYLAQKALFNRERQWENGNRFEQITFKEEGESNVNLCLLDGSGWFEKHINLCNLILDEIYTEEERGRVIRCLEKLILQIKKADI